MNDLSYYNVLGVGWKLSYTQQILFKEKVEEWLEKSNDVVASGHSPLYTQSSPKYRNPRLIPSGKSIWRCTFYRERNTGTEA